VENYFVQTGLGGAVTHRISPRWDAQAGATNLRLDYGSRLPVAGDDVSTAPEFVRSYNAGLGFYFSRGLRVGVRGEHVSRASGRPNADYQNVRLMTTVNYTFR
jgi:hypothetical protein